MAGIHRTSKLGHHSLKALWNKELVGLLYVLGVVGTIYVSVIIEKPKATSVVKRVMKKCPKNKQGAGNLGYRAQSSWVARPKRAAPRGSTSDSGGEANRLYAIMSHQEQENSSDVVTSMIKVFAFDVYAFLDPGATLSFVTPILQISLIFSLKNFVNPSMFLDLLGSPF